MTKPDRLILGDDLLAKVADVMKDDSFRKKIEALVAERGARPRSPYKDNGQASGECEGKPGDLVEFRLRPDKGFKPHKFLIEESEPGATKIAMALASDGKNVFAGHGKPEFVEAAWLRPNPLGSGTTLPTLYIDDEYVVRVQFEKAAKVFVWMAGPAMKDEYQRRPK